MPQLPDSLRILAALRLLDEQEFTQLLQARRVNIRGIEDLLDLAEWLETSANIAASLQRLDWPTLRGMRLGTPDALRRAAGLQLAVRTDDRSDPAGSRAEETSIEADGADVELLPEVRRQLTTLITEVPEFTPQAVTETGSAEALAAHAIAQLANDALWLLRSESRVVRHARDRVRLSGVDVRRLATELDRDAALVGSMYRWLLAADLIAPLGETWALTQAGDSFATRSVAERWQILVQAWLRELSLAQLCTLLDSLQLRSTRGQFEAPSLCAEEVGLGTSPMTLQGVADSLVADAEALGLVTRGELSRLGGLVLDLKLETAASELAAQLPEEITQVYLQPDQTILAPGPLPGPLDVELRRVAELENRALASEYRLTPASITGALNAGMSEAEIRALLARISLTGVPQPVDYLVANAASQHGRVRVRSTDRGTRIRAASAELRDALSIDTALSTLGLAVVGDELATRVNANVAVSSLLDARYPAILEGPDGEPLPRTNDIVAAEYVAAPTPTAARTAAELADQAATRDHADDRSVWLQRRLELARRNKTEVMVTIDVPGKDPVRIGVVPLSVGPQRFRARDFEADVERTLPLRSIIAIEEV